ncbi:flippase-like domain-containing protein [Phormidium sp. LEGE 05292]|uniref:lysylphosphatidylglycerol synthase transmembrane domain-containing protein n=1 Tax=[Phormidium] sp. LEGE 05292 TaxID=767427 RepID=UPI0018809B8B|nr:lysylphosphatidylglycerol synthase domain-containing protein [Phormidium sp. LEGE 05292]MBE9227698.1 flippase-like domain-containing protein [Phormidium sp. LEGE 05292]
MKISSFIRQLSAKFKPYLRWVILGVTLFFLAKVLKDHAAGVAAIRINGKGWEILAIAFSITLLAHIWSAWVWVWIFHHLKQPITAAWGIPVYLKTNIAKYIPGNVWHFYGRIVAAKQKGVSLEIATVAVLLEPLLMAASALIFAVIGIPLLWSHNSSFLAWQLLGLVVVLIAIHPRILNRLILKLSKSKQKSGSVNVEATALPVKSYPLVPLLGEICFVGFRGTGFLLTLRALGAIEPSKIPLLFTAFSLAWLLGLIVPGAPGGLGVFEATILTILGSSFSPALMLATVALYRLISILAEIAGAGLGTFYQLIVNNENCS